MTMIVEKMMIVGMGCLALLVLIPGCMTSGGNTTKDVVPPQGADVKSPRPVIATNDPVTATFPPVAVVSNKTEDDSGPYRIHPGDTLHLQVSGEDDSSGEFKVAPDGTIVHALLGRTVSELEKSLTDDLGKDFLVNPKVYLQVRSSVTRRVILFGEVKVPGVYDLPVDDRFTLLQLIARAGGFTDVAASDRVRVVRRRGGVEQTFKINVTDLLKGAGTDIELQPNDVVTIPQTVF